jgi:hypothetical protein
MPITTRGFFAPQLDAAGVDCQIVLERRLIEVPMDRAEKSEVRATSRHGEQASAGRGVCWRAGERRSNKSGDQNVLGYRLHLRAPCN